MTEQEIKDRLAVLYAAQEAATSWGAAVGARHEEIQGLERSLRTIPRSSSGSAVAWQFRQRSGVGKGPQSQAPWGEWCGITREIYDLYIEAPNSLVEVRALTILDHERQT